MIDYSLDTVDAVWAMGQCMLAFGLGFIVGMKIKLIRKIEEMV